MDKATGQAAVFTHTIRDPKALSSEGTRVFALPGGCNARLSWAFVAATMAAALGAGCGAGAAIPATPTVTITAPTTTPTIEQGQTVNFVATSSQTGGVTWSLSTGAIGTLSNQTTTTATYVAPAAVTASTTVTVIATSVATTTLSTQIDVTITPPIGIIVTPALSSVAALGGAKNFTASVVYDENALGVAWSVSGPGCVGAGCGTLTSATTTSVTYEAPNTPPSPNTVTLTATSVADNARSGASTISVTPPLPVVVTIANKAAFGVAGGPAIVFNATAQNDPTSRGVAWTLSAGGSSRQPLCGSLSGQTSSSVIYTPPPAPPPAAPNNQPTITATSLFDGTKSDSSSFPILAAPPSACAGTPTGKESLLSGEYAFVVQGYQGSPGSAAAIAASFAANGTGGVTGGEMDRNSSAGYQHAMISGAGSSYTVGADPTGAGNLGCVTLQISAGTAVTFHFALGVVSAGAATEGRVIEFDDTTGSGTLASGILRRQDATSFALAALNSKYAFGLDGADSSGNPAVIAGSFSVNAAGTISATVDVNDAGALSTSAIPGAAGNISSISLATGRATATIGTGQGASYAWAIYLVSANQFFIIDTDTLGAATPIASGRAVVTASSFSQSSLAGNYIVHFTGTSNCNSVACATGNLGLLTFNAGIVSGTITQYDSYAGSQTLTLTPGTYAVDPASGRVTLSGAAIGVPIVLDWRPRPMGSRRLWWDRTARAHWASRSSRQARPTRQRCWPETTSSAPRMPAIRASPMPWE